MWFSTFQLHCNSNNLGTTQDMYKLIKCQMAMAYKGSLVEMPPLGTYWVYEPHNYNLGNHLVIQSRMSRSRSVCTQSHLCIYLQQSSPLTETGRIKQRILCCRKFIIIFGSSDLFIKQIACTCSWVFSFRAWQKYCILSFLSLGRFSEGVLINILLKKNAFVPVFALTILWLFAILKPDFFR